MTCPGSVDSIFTAWQINLVNLASLLFIIEQKRCYINHGVLKALWVGGWLVDAMLFGYHNIVNNNHLMGEKKRNSAVVLGALEKKSALVL